MEIWTDLFHGLKLLRRSPGFAAAAVFTLALGLGANSAIFSIVNAVLLRPLPYVEPDRLVKVWEVFPRQEEHRQFRFSEIELLDVRDGSGDVFAGLAAYSVAYGNLAGNDDPEQVLLARVSPNFFDVLGGRAALGRVFSPREERPGADKAVILSQGLWQRRFGGDPGVLGRSLSLDSESYLVIGVMPAGFQFPDRSEAGGLIEMWVPAAFDRASLPAERWGKSGRHLDVLGRLAPGISLERARVELDAVARSFREQYPDSYAESRGFGLRADSLLETQIGAVRPALLALFGAGLLVLLIGCVNVANLLLIRSYRRGRELAIRTAIGASRKRLARQLLAESLLLALLGGAAGLLLAFGVLRSLGSLIPVDIPRSGSISLDLYAFGFTLALSLLAGALAGLAPVLQVASSDLFGKLKDGAGRSSDNIRGRRFRSALVVAEVAIALVVLVGGGLLIRNFVLLTRVDPGFDPDRVLTMKIAVSELKTEDPVRMLSFQSELLARVRSLPGVQEAGLVSQLPLGGTNSSHGVTVEGASLDASGAAYEVDFRSASPGYFQAMGIPLLAGRSFAASDGQDAAGVVIVDELLARRYWLGEDPLGKRLKQGRPDSTQPWLTVIGVVRHVKHVGVDQDSEREQIYYSYLQRPWPDMSLVLRSTSADPLTLAGPVRAQLREIDGDQPAAEVRSMQDWYSESLSKPRFSMLLLSLFALVSLVLVAVGTYGVIATSTLERTQEIGIRMALGAKRSSALELVVRHSLGLALLGVTIGILLTLLSTRLLESQVHRLSVTDPLTIVGVSLFLLMIVLVASLLPAYRATRVDPILALRRQ